MAEETRQETAVRSGDDVTCPNCGSHNVRCIPYPKVEFGLWFVLWLIVAFGGYMISVFITIVGIIFWSIALVIRLKQNKLARQYVRMQCITCLLYTSLSAYNGFFGCKHFSKCNAFLEAHGIDPIDWDLNH